MSTVHFYTSCTMTKSAAAPNQLMARALGDQPMSRRFALWSSRIDRWKGERRSALQLYCGGAWSIVRSLAAGNSCESPRVRCFVISAGYGLVGIDTQLAPYAATFTPGRLDSVANAQGNVAPKQNGEWWQKLCAWRPVGIGGPRSIRAAFRKFPNSVHIVALSPSYLDAIFEDLAEGLFELSNPEKLIVISAGKKRHGDLNGWVLSPPAELQTVLGGALVSLNVRLAAEILNRNSVGGLSQAKARAFVSRLKAKAQPRAIPTRRPVRDAHVIRFIRHSDRSRSRLSYTSLLRDFRSAGYACEMKRFKQLFQQTLHSRNRSV